MNRKYITREEANQLVELGVPTRCSSEPREWLDANPGYSGLGYYLHSVGWRGAKNWWIYLE